MWNKTIRLVSDFETTVYDGQTRTDVWAAATCRVGERHKDNVNIQLTIEDYINYILTFPGNIIVYFHNLKFDGMFIVDYLLNHGYIFNRVKDSDMKNRDFKCSISDRGQWYTITIKRYGKVIEFRDSLKLLPMSVEKVGKSFKTQHQKTSIEYRGFREPGQPISEIEEDYIKNDVLVMSEGLDSMFAMGVDGLTIGSACMKKYKKDLFVPNGFRSMFPDLSKFGIDNEIFGASNADEYIRKSYRGGYCYLKRGQEGEHDLGWTADINSSYPSNMHSGSGNKYPIGNPVFHIGFPDEKYLDERYYYFVRFSCRFKIKPKKLPTVQIKGNFLYPPNDYLETSDVYDKKTGQYVRYYYWDGVRKEARVTLTMTKTDWELFNEHYEIYDLDIHDSATFMAQSGIFDDYIDYWYKIKENNTGGMRELAKLYLNNLYGKFATNDNSSYKVPYLGEDGIVHFETVTEHEKELVYIAVGSAITSYARRFVIQAAQANYDNFIYCDTDSIHCKGEPEPKGIRIHPTKLLHWKLESQWDYAKFVRQKTYIEHITHNDGVKLEEPCYNIKCAGMSKAAKKEFLSKCNASEFGVGLKLESGLKPVIVKGGVVLADHGFLMRKKVLYGI